MASGVESVSVYFNKNNNYCTNLICLTVTNQDMRDGNSLRKLLETKHFMNLRYLDIKKSNPLDLMIYCQIKVKNNHKMYQQNFNM